MYRGKLQQYAYNLQFKFAFAQFGMDRYSENPEETFKEIIF